jgi:hypothetical protein
LGKRPFAIVELALGAVRARAFFFERRGEVLFSLRVVRDAPQSFFELLPAAFSVSFSASRARVSAESSFLCISSKFRLSSFASSRAQSPARSASRAF